MNNYQYASHGKNSIGFNVNAGKVYTGYTTALPDNPVVAMAYVPFQTDSTTYDEMTALKCGTLFPCLNKPFLGRGAR